MPMKAEDATNGQGHRGHGHLARVQGYCGAELRDVGTYFPSKTYLIRPASSGALGPLHNALLDSVTLYGIVRLQRHYFHCDAL